MKKTTKLTILLSFIIAISYIFINTILLNQAKESITYFPIDPSLAFLSSNTALTLKGGEEDQYMINWRVRSETDKEVFLRQDVSLLFRDGILVDTMFKWKENHSKLVQDREITGKDSSLYEAISFHHAEIHPNQNEIKSSQIMTKDKLYVIDSSFSPLKAFHVPSTKEQEEWKKIIDHVYTQDLQNTWNELFTHFQINPKNYSVYTLLNLEQFNIKTIPGFTKEQTQAVIGRLWEGLYKNYVLGIRLSEDEVISPIGSKLPLILISKDRSHLFIITEGKNGEKVKLLQELN